MAAIPPSVNKRVFYSYMELDSNHRSHCVFQVIMWNVNKGMTKDRGSFLQVRRIDLLSLSLMYKTFHYDENLLNNMSSVKNGSLGFVGVFVVLKCGCIMDMLMVLN